nr:secondary thiamine-phosphate synthase enzyme YjbQ [Corallococcus llansteffanensis]
MHNSCGNEPCFHSRQRRAATRGGRPSQCRGGEREERQPHHEFQHDAEGPDDMPAHVRTVLTQVSLRVPVKDGAADLGTWQGVYLWEHRTSPHRRRVTVSVLGG